MIGLVLSMVKARWVQAVTLVLLATVAVAAAVAGPVSMRATDAAIVRLEVANASARERSISIILVGSSTDPGIAGQVNTLVSFLALPGFEIIRGGELLAFGPAPDAESALLRPETRLGFRDGLCDHVTVVAGRCLIGGMEIVIGEQTAAETGLRPGDVATLQPMTYGSDAQPIPAGPPVALTVVGVYHPVDVDSPYWGGHPVFVTKADGSREEPVFTTVAAMPFIEHRAGETYVDAMASDAALTPQRLESVPEEIGDVRERLVDLPNGLVTTGLLDLAERVGTSRELARQVGPVAFIPLAGISIFVIYLAVAYGIVSRRAEVGLVALRGVSTRRRWVLATAETIIPIMLGAPLGYVLGHLGVAALARARLGSDEGTELSLESLPYAAVALGIAVVVALLGQRRAVREPVIDLLRGVPPRRAAWSAITAETLLAALAIVATIQLRQAGEGISGLGLLVPGLVVVVVALVAARLNVLVTGGVARLALRRGLLGAGLSAVQLARRPGSHRLFVLLAVGTAMLAFVAAGMDVAGRAREERATVLTGAPGVLKVVGVDARRLLAATTEVDPEGAWAMAVMVVPPATTRDPTVLAVDTSRLPAVATWRPEFGAEAAEVAAAIGPPAPAPLEFRGTALSVDVEVVSDRAAGPRGIGPRPVELILEFVTLDGARLVSAPLRDLAVGRHTVTVPVAACADGCRLTAFVIPEMESTTRLILHGVRQLDPPAEVVPPSELTNGDRWRVPQSVAVVPGRQSLEVWQQVVGPAIGATVRVGVVDAPTPVPVASVGEDHLTRVNSVDDAFIPAQTALHLSMMPRLGTRGVLADLRYLERTVLGQPVRGDPEIWLGPAAPADAADRFRATGLPIAADITAAQRRAALGRQGPALALHFHLAAAALGVLLALGGLGLVAAVDRRQRAADLRALRVQGLPRRMARRAALWGYLSIVVLAALTGLVGAAVAWATVGDRLPIFTDASSELTPPRWPLWVAVVQPWAVAAGAMAAGAVLAAWALRRAVARGNGGTR